MTMTYGELGALIGSCLFIGALVPFTLLTVAAVAILKDIRG